MVAETRPSVRFRVGSVIELRFTFKRRLKAVLFPAGINENVSWRTVINILFIFILDIKALKNKVFSALVVGATGAVTYSYLTVKISNTSVAYYTRGFCSIDASL